MPFQVLTNVVMGLVAAAGALLIQLLSEEMLLEDRTGC